MYRVCGCKKNHTVLSAMSLVAPRVNGEIRKSGRRAAVDQVSDSSVIANTELKRVDPHNNVK